MTRLSARTATVCSDSSTPGGIATTFLALRSTMAYVSSPGPPKWPGRYRVSRPCRRHGATRCGCACCTRRCAASTPTGSRCCGTWAPTCARYGPRTRRTGNCPASTPSSTRGRGFRPLVVGAPGQRTTYPPSVLRRSMLCRMSSVMTGVRPPCLPLRSAVSSPPAWTHRCSPVLSPSLRRTRTAPWEADVGVEAGQGPGEHLSGPRFATPLGGGDQRLGTSHIAGAGLAGPARPSAVGPAGERKRRPSTFDRTTRSVRRSPMPRHRRRPAAEPTRGRRRRRR